MVDKADNFVEIVGYQLEKIHTGVIAWLLDSDRSPLPLSEQSAIIDKLDPGILPNGRMAGAKAIREYSFGRRRRIDLVLEIRLEDGQEAYLLIECKTDSDVSVDQLKESVAAFSETKPGASVSAMVLAIGAGRFTLAHQMHELECNNFQSTDLSRTLEIFSGLSISGTTHTYDCWIASMESEQMRSSQIERALACREHPWDPSLFEAGYRSAFPVFYMFYGKLREHLEKGPYKGWGIYSGRNNPVLNWQEGWIPVARGTNEIELCWEFNWCDFCLKAAIGENWEFWQTIRAELIPLCESCPVTGRASANRPGKSATAYRWEFDFCNTPPRSIAEETAKILHHLNDKLGTGVDQVGP